MANNKRRLILALAFNKLVDLLASAKTTLPALLLSLSAPVWMVAWLVPIRESGALLPQAFIGVYLRKHEARHHVWRLGMALQICAITTPLLAALVLSGVAAGAVVLTALVALSIGRSACSLTIKDMEADVAEKGERGRLVGIASTASGLMTLCVAVPLVYYQQALQNYAVIGLVAGSSVSFIITLLCLLPVKTYVKAEDNNKGQEGSDDENRRLLSVNFDRTVYTFIAVRGLFVHSALVAPYFMLESDQKATSLLPVYLAAQALAALLSSFLWGKVADKSARSTLQIAGILALSACVALLVFNPNGLWFSALLFFVLSVAHAGVRTGRKTYSLDVKEGQGRTELVGFSNTAIGLILLAFGGLYAFLSSVLTFSVVYIMAAMLVVAIISTIFLPKEK